MAANQGKAQASGDPHDADKRRKTIYKVVVNHEEQYSIWPIDRRIPLGWREDAKQGTQEECQNYIRKVSTDKRPNK